MVARKTTAAVITAAMGLIAGTLSAQQPPGGAWQEYQLEARIWLDRGPEPVLQQGERVRVYYRVSEDANVAIFHIDTDGTVRLVFPRSPRENHIVLGARDYRVLFPETSYWFVDDYPGMGYFFVVASPDPVDLSQFTYSHYDGGWDLSRVGRQVYSDPHEAIDDYVAALIPNWESAAYGLDFTSYHVGESHEYPRFLCYDCHGFQPYYAWNPYYYACTSFRVVVYDDPYFYPSYRYGGGVVVTPPAQRLPQFVFKERAVGEPGTVLLTSRPDFPSGTTRRSGGVGGSSAEGRGVPAWGEPGRTTGKENAAADSDQGSLVVPWPGRTTRSTTTPRSGGVERPLPSDARMVPTGGVGSTTGRPNVRPSSNLIRPVLERRRPPNGVPATSIDRSGRVIPSGARRPNGPQVRPPATGTIRPSSSPRSGGSVRPSSPPRSGGSVRPSSPPRSGGSVRPSSPPRGGGGAAPARMPTRPTPAVRPPRRKNPAS